LLESFSKKKAKPKAVQSPKSWIASEMIAKELVIIPPAISIKMKIRLRKNATEIFFSADE
jgi:hypothetical protein